MSRLTEKQFEKYLKISIQNYGHTYFDILEEWKAPHTFSPAFEAIMDRKMQKLEKEYPKPRKSSLRKTLIVLAIVFAILATTVLSVGALRSTLFNFITNVFPTHTEVQIKSDDVSAIQQYNTYQINPIPEGFQKTYRSAQDLNAGFVTSSYTHDESYVIFSQYLQSAYTSNINTEGTQMTPIDIRGHHGFSVSLETETYLAWEEDQYVFTLTGNVDQTVLLEFANNIIVE